MIGAQFLFRLVQVTLACAIFAVAGFGVLFAFTWIIRAFAEGAGYMFSDHWKWLKSKIPKRRRRKKKVSIDTAKMTDAEREALISVVRSLVNNDEPDPDQLRVLEEIPKYRSSGERK